jgi:dimeric dUTPase (all-alpha-NTP-PPase superfamily)
MDKDPQWRWLESTRRLQAEAYGIVFEETDVAHQAESIKDNVLPLMVEAGELLNNVSWKYWAHDEPFVDRAKVLKEAVDIGHFLANILIAISATDEEWEEAYQRKQTINRMRQLDGYTVRDKADDAED